MRHRSSTVKLGRTSSHRRAMLRNMVTSLLREERVVTTVPKAKVARRVADRMITFAKRGDIHARRQAARVVQDPKVLQKLFDDLGPRFEKRAGGYTRILKTGFRAGDNAPMSILELVENRAVLAEEHAAPTDAKEKRKAARRAAPDARKEPKKKAAPRKSKTDAKKAATGPAVKKVAKKAARGK